MLLRIRTCVSSKNMLLLRYTTVRNSQVLDKIPYNSIKWIQRRENMMEKEIKLLSPENLPLDLGELGVVTEAEAIIPGVYEASMRQEGSLLLSETFIVLSEAPTLFRIMQCGCAATSLPATGIRLPAYTPILCPTPFRHRIPAHTLCHSACCLASYCLSRTLRLFYQPSL